MSLRHLIYFVFVLTCWQSIFRQVEGSDPEFFNIIDKLHAKLLQNYRRDIRPVATHTDTLDVTASLTMTSFDFNEMESRFSARGYFYMSWKDPRLSWTPSEYDGLQTIHLPSEKVWKPDFEIYNTAGEISEDRSFAATPVLITYNGTVLFVPMSNLVSTCIADPTRYPFDKVTCATTIGSWTHNAHEVIMNIKDNQTKVNLEDLVSPKISSWNLVDTNVSLIVTIYKCCPEPYQSLKLEYMIQRSSSISPTVIAQAIAIVILTMAVFFITPSTNAKLIVGMINLELISANLLYFHSTLPSGHVNKIPLIVSFYCGSLILTALSILTSIICLRWTRIPISSTPPVFVLKCLDGRVGRILGTNQGTRTGATAAPVTSILSEKPQQNGSGANESRDDDAGIQHQWMTVFLALDRILTIVYCGCLGYFIIGYHLG